MVVENQVVCIKAAQSPVCTLLGLWRETYRLGSTTIYQRVAIWKLLRCSELGGLNKFKYGLWSVNATLTGSPTHTARETEQ